MVTFIGQPDSALEATASKGILPPITADIVMFHVFWPFSEHTVDDATDGETVTLPRYCIVESFS
jgi:hypothetical protein